MVRKMHILLRLLGLVFVARLPLILSCQYTTGSETSCSNATDQPLNPNLLGEKGDVENKSTDFVDYVNVGDSALKYFEIAKRIWNTNRALKLYLVKNEHNDTVVELRFTDGDDEASEDVHQRNEGK